MTLSARTDRGLLTGVALLAAALTAGCGSSPSSSSSTPAAPASSASAASSAASSSPTATASASAPSSGSATAPGGTAGSATAPGGTAGAAPACATRDLKASAGAAQGAAGSVYQAIDFTNISGKTCTLYGYPGVALAAGSPVTQVGAAATRSNSAAPKLVTLAAGGTANALLRITQALNYPTAQCDPVATTYLQIYPPNQTTPIYLAYKSTGCKSTSVKLLTIGVVQPGAGNAS
jgi:hypothetical protein